MDPDTPAAQRLGAIKSFLLDHDALLPALASRLGGRGAEFETAIRGDSMAPAIPMRARLRVRLLSEQSCQRSDIVFYLSDSGFMVHRVAHLPRRGAAAGYLLTLGDNCLVPDPPVREDRILGTVTAVQTASGWHPPGPLVDRSVCHRLVRAAASGAVIAASWFGVPAARWLIIVLQKLVSVIRVPAGRVLRHLRLTSSGR